MLHVLQVLLATLVQWDQAEACTQALRGALEVSQLAGFICGAASTHACNMANLGALIWLATVHKVVEEVSLRLCVKLMEDMSLRLYMG